MASGVSKYSGFRLVDCVSVYESSGRVSNVPGSKEDIFKNKDISLIEKRRLMRFLTFAIGEFESSKELEGKQEIPFVEFLQNTFSLNGTLSSIIAYALAFSPSKTGMLIFTIYFFFYIFETESSLPALQRLRGYLRSSGRYGPSPFLIGHYGCIGDISQGFCRAAAVSGAVYILGREIKSISRASQALPLTSDEGVLNLEAVQPFNFHIELDDFPDILESSMLISSSSFLPNDFAVNQLASSKTDTSSRGIIIARSIIIIDKGISLKPPPPASQEASPREESSEEEEGSTTDQVPLDHEPTDTGVLVFPPSTVAGGSSTHSATVLLVGEGSMATPKGKCKFFQFQLYFLY